MSCNNKVQAFNELNEDSYESKDLELEDIYESDEGQGHQRGIPANLVYTSHQINENILSLFPANIYEQ